MKAIKQRVTSEIVEKKSKFIGDIFYVETIEEAEKKIEEIKKKYHDAKHHCFAYRILTDERVVERASDDGEPSGTAGQPMLQLLSKNDIAQVLVIVTRYFGGILLGTGGLLRAYTKTASNALEKTELVELEQGEVLKIPVTYQNLPYLQYYCKKENITILETNFNIESYAIIEICTSQKDKMLQEIEQKQFDIEKIEILEKKYLQKNNEK